MPQPELVNFVVRALGAAGVEYMLTGSLVSSMQGEPRATHDMDLVVDLKVEQVHGLVGQFPEEKFYVREEAACDAVRKRSMFNILSLEDGDKIDLWLLKDDEYDRARFSRKYVAEVLGGKMPVSRPEDTILFKLKWAGMCGGSEKQFKDALRVFEVQGRKLDENYMERWATALGVDAALRRLKDEATPC